MQKAFFFKHLAINSIGNKFRELCGLIHCVKSVRVQGYSGQHFPAFGLNTERYRVSLRIQSECGKIRTRITPNTDTFHAVINGTIPVRLKLIWVWYVRNI